VERTWEEKGNMFDQPTSYLSTKLEGRPRPKQEDKGVFACQMVKAGEMLVVWGGEVFTWERLIRMPLHMRRLSLQVEENLYLVSSQEGPADWVNHSCDPNAGMSGQIVLVAMRDIAPGEEVCFDYAMTDGSPYDEFECQCGAHNCRRYVTGNDWRQPELWERYAGYFSPYLQQRIDRLKEARYQSWLRRLVSSATPYEAEPAVPRGANK
jgi:hypothetical protein